jgi:hypothetical protein
LNITLEKTDGSITDLHSPDLAPEKRTP